MAEQNFITNYTGAEINQAIKRALGNIYGDSITPGSRLVGAFIEDPVNLNELRYPGRYTAYFYTYGPKSLSSVNGNTPISIDVFKNENPELTTGTGAEGDQSLWQTIIALSYATEEIPASNIHPGDVIVNVYFRDLLKDDIENEASTTDGYGWRCALLTSGALSIINNLKSHEETAALSANMGRYLLQLINEDDDGCFNLLPSSGPKANNYKTEGFFTTHWTFNPTVTEMRNEHGVTNIFPTVNDIHANIPFDPVSYFNAAMRNDYVRLATWKDKESAYIDLKSDFLIPLNPDDKAFTASVMVRARQRNELVEPWVECFLFDENKNVISQMIKVETDQTTTVDRDGDERPDTEDGNIVYEKISEEYFSDVKNEVEIALASDGTTDLKWYKITATVEKVYLFYERFNARYAGMRFGFKNPNIHYDGNTILEFSNAKLEKGRIATDSSLTLAEMWHEFNNANYINEIPVSHYVDINRNDAHKLKDGQGLVYESNSTSWVNKYITTGGGGGFVAQPYPPDLLPEASHYKLYDDVNLPDRRKLLWYVTGMTDFVCTNAYYPTLGNETYSCFAESFHYYDETQKRWLPCERNYIVSRVAPTNTNKLWLDISIPSYSEYEPPDLKYYDTAQNPPRWRTVGSEPRPAWVITDIEPSGADKDLMWITTKGVAAVPWTHKDDNGNMITEYLPLQAIWGHNAT